MNIMVVNKHAMPALAEHMPLINIMRPHVLGNPFPIIKGTTERDEVISQYDMWLEDQMKSGNAPVLDAMETIATLAQQDTGVMLMCCCKPANCHGDVIKRYIVNALSGREPWSHMPMVARPRRFIKS